MTYISDALAFATPDSLRGKKQTNIFKEANSNAYKKEMTPLQALLENNETPPALMVFTDAVKEFAPGK